MTRSITTVAVGDQYQRYAQRLETSCKKFSNGTPLHIWRDWPQGSPTHPTAEAAVEAAKLDKLSHWFPMDYFPRGEPGHGRERFSDDQRALAKETVGPLCEQLEYDL